VSVALAALGALVVSLDASVNIAFPAMSAAFDVGPVSIRWVIVCYVLTYALTAFGAGLLADRFGPGPVFTAGLWISAAAFAGYLAVSSFGLLLAARVLQGVGGGLIYGTAPALITLALPRERHGFGLGRLALGMGAGLALGPIIGGALVDASGWRAVFLFRAPLALTVGILSWLLLPRGGRVGPWRLPPCEEWRRGSVLAALLLSALANWAQFAVWLLVPYYLVGVLGLPAARAGFLFMLTPLGTAAMSPLAGRITDRMGPRLPITLGLTAEAAGLFLIGRLDAASPWLGVGAALALVGLGLGLFQVPNLAQVMRAFPAARQGAAGGLAFMSRTLGIVAGVQASATVFGGLERALGWSAAFTAAFTVAGGVCALAAAFALLSVRPIQGRGGPGLHGGL
jgi:MFS family permease